MTNQTDILNDAKYKPVHKHGFVGLIDVMGDDSAIVNAARVSYGKNLEVKTPKEDRALIRYLMRHQHTTPFEMLEFKFHIKLPIFVMRQHIRHRTASVNEYSARYSEMSNEFYIPEQNYVKKQSTTNKQGREESYSDLQSSSIILDFLMSNEKAYDVYNNFINKYDLAKELSRLVLPVSNYTECYWKIDLKNLFHYFKLRKDSHAQQEIRDFANTMYDLAKPYAPYAFEAYEDYMENSYTLSSMEIKALRDILSIYEKSPISGSELEKMGMSKRETGDFINKFFTANKED